MCCSTHRNGRNSKTLPKIRADRAKITNPLALGNHELLGKRNLTLESGGLTRSM